MIEIDIDLQAPDFDKFEIEIQCPICKLENPIRLGEIRRREFTICRGCHCNILLEDHLGKYQRFVKSFNKTLENLF